MTHGVILALLAYASFSLCDATTKALGGSLSIFEIGFFQMLFAGVFLLATRTEPGERRRDFLHAKKPWLVHCRGLAGTCGAMLSTYAFTTIPLAESYALIFLSPTFVTLLSALVLKEKVGLWRWAALAIGFLGVLLVVRPGFRELHLGHLAAVGVAVVAGCIVIIVRSLGPHERRTTLIGIMLLYGIAFNGIAMILAGFKTPSPSEFVLLVLVGTFTGLGQNLFLSGLRLAPANRVAPTHYSQILWAIVFGALFFGEYPDWVALVGMAVVAASGLITFMRERFARAG